MLGGIWNNDGKPEIDVSACGLQSSPKVNQLFWSEKALKLTDSKVSAAVGSAHVVN